MRWNAALTVSGPRGKSCLVPLRNYTPMKHLPLIPALVAATGLAHATVFQFTATLDGPSESPANASPATGTATFSYDSVLKTFSIDTTFTGLTGNTTAAHIHAPTAVAGTGTAGVATQTPSFVGFPLGVTSGSYNQTFDLGLASTYRSGFITANGGTPAGAETAFINAINAGQAYLNIHTSAFPGGEIRGFLTPVPEPGETCVVVGALMAGFAAFRHYRKTA